MGTDQIHRWRDEVKENLRRVAHRAGPSRRLPRQHAQNMRLRFAPYCNPLQLCLRLVLDVSVVGGPPGLFLAKG